MKLPSPLRPLLDESVDEASLQRIWRGVEERRRPRPRRAALVRFAGPALAGLALVVAVAVWLDRTPAPLPSPLAVANGDALGKLLAARDPRRPLRVDLSDRSFLDLSAGARLEVGENTGDRFDSVLHVGAVTFHVRPGGARRWTVHAGPLTVEVTGTRFVVSRERSAVTVSVQRGHVRVMSEALEPPLRVLGAGQSVTVRTEPSGGAADIAPAPPEATTPEPSGPAPASPASADLEDRPNTTARRSESPRPGTGTSAPSPTPPTDDGSASSDWRDARQSGDHRHAYELLGAGGVQRETSAAADPATLLALADVARLSGHPAEAVPPLERVARDFAGDARAAVAAFTLGRVRLGELGQPAAAAQAFELALRLGLPAGLQESAQARLVEAHARAGNVAGARAAGQRYHERYPEGRHKALVQRWQGE